MSFVTSFLTNIKTGKSREKKHPRKKSKVKAPVTEHKSCHMMDTKADDDIHYICVASNKDKTVFDVLTHLYKLTDLIVSFAEVKLNHKWKIGIDTRDSDYRKLMKWMQEEVESEPFTITDWSSH